MTCMEFEDEIRQAASLLAATPVLDGFDAHLHTRCGAVAVSLAGDGFDTVRLRASWWYRPILVSCDARMIVAVVARMMEGL
jgi:hypothetical protein